MADYRLLAAVEPDVDQHAGCGRILSRGATKPDACVTAAEACARSEAVGVERFDEVAVEAELLEEVEVVFDAADVELRRHHGELDGFHLLNHGERSFRECRDVGAVFFGRRAVPRRGERRLSRVEHRLGRGVDAVERHRRAAAGEDAIDALPRRLGRDAERFADAGETFLLIEPPDDRLAVARRQVGDRIFERRQRRIVGRRLLSV